MHDIETLERRLPEMTSDDTDLVTELDEKKVALEEINNHTAQGAYVRSRATYKVEGERPTKMFCELEKYNGVQKFVPQFILENEEQGAETIRNQKGVEDIESVARFGFFRGLKLSLFHGDHGSNQICGHEPQKNED